MQKPRTREPIYDGVGPRTSADGSSMGTLPRKSASGMASPCLVSGNHMPHQKYSLGPYYAPIAELQVNTLSLPLQGTAPGLSPPIVLKG